MSDLDEEELRATKNMQSSAEKTADVMFAELGYKKRTEGFYQCAYTKNDKSKQLFFSDSLEIKIYGENRELTMQELQAINKKVKELGWND